MVLVLACVLTAALTSSGWFAFREQARSIHEETNQRGEDLVRIVSKSLAFAAVGYDYQSIQHLLDEVVVSKDVTFARVTSAKGNTMADSGAVADTAHQQTFVKAIMFDEEVVGEITIGFDNRRIVSQLKSQRFSYMFREGLLIVLIALGEFMALSYLIVRPVSVISRAMQDNVDDRGLVTKDIPIKSSDEFGRLASIFNEMRVQLNVAYAKLQDKVDVADSKLRETNSQLLEQSDELQRMNEELKRLTITDALTGLHNRRHFEDLMQNEISRSLRYGDSNSMLVFDIDFFKKVNDTYGHDTGDVVLRSVAKMIRNNLRSTDLVCRVGGEEFVAFCICTNQHQAVRIADVLRKRIEQAEIEVGHKKIKVTVSIGIASVPENKENPVSVEEFFKHADTALYYSKDNGRNRVTHYNDIRADLEAAKS